MWSGYADGEACANILHLADASEDVHSDMCHMFIFGVIRHLRVVVVGLAVLSAGVPSAGADSQPVSAVAASLLGLAVSAPVVLSPLTPGATSIGASAVTVTSTGPWVLRVQDSDATHPGHLLRTSGSTGDAFLTSALGWATTPAAGGTGASGALSGSATVAASGTLTNVVVLAFSQLVGAGEQLAAGLGYGLTVTWTVSPT